MGTARGSHRLSVTMKYSDWDASIDPVFGCIRGKFCAPLAILVIGGDYCYDNGGLTSGKRSVMGVDDFRIERSGYGFPSCMIRLWTIFVGELGFHNRCVQLGPGCSRGKLVTLTTLRKEESPQDSCR